MSERLSELSASVSLEVRTRVEEARAKIKAASVIIESLSKEPVIGDGTRTVLDEIVLGLEKSDELHVGVLKLIGETYGHDKTTNGGVLMDYVEGATPLPGDDATGEP